MSFKLTNISIFFQSLINNILKEYLNQFYIIYLNNILIYSEIKEQYIKYIQKILRVL